MGEAILKNLHKKTGKSLEEWLLVVGETGLSEKKEIISELKINHGLGHFQAQKIFEAFKGVDIYQKPDELVNELFHSVQLKQQYEEVKSSILTFGDDIRIQPCKTYVPFYRKNRFAIATLDKNGQLIIGLNMPEDFQHDKFEKVKSKAGERINFQATAIDSKGNMDKEVIQVINQSYSNN